MKRISIWSALAAMAFAALATAASAQQELLEDAKDGLSVGEKAPDFTLKDQNGEDVSLSGLLKDGKVALVFYRSASW